MIISGVFCSGFIVNEPTSYIMIVLYVNMKVLNAAGKCAETLEGCRFKLP